MEIKHHAVGLKTNFGLAAALTLLMLIAPLSSMLGGTGMEFIGDANASNATNPTNQTNQTTSVSTNCAVSYTSQIQSSTSVQMNITGDYLIQAAPDYYLVDMVCSTTVGNTVFLLLTHQGVSLYQNLTISNLTMGVNTTTGHNQIINYYWHDGVNVGVGHIVIVPLSNPIDTTPRISMWPGKVNQHNWNGTWLTDPDGVSGGHPSTLYSNDYGDRKVEYCQKWWPATTAVQLLPLRETITFYTAGNAVAYDSTKDVYECLMASVNQEWIDFDFSNNHSNYVDVGESLEGEYSVGLMNPGVNYNVNLTVWRDNGTLFQTHSYVESTTFTSDDENAYGIYNNAEHGDWIPLAAGAPGQYNMNGDCFYAIAVLFGNGTYITETIYEFSVTTLDCDYHYNTGNGSQSGSTTPVNPPPSSGNQSGNNSSNTGNGSRGGTSPPSTNPTPPPAENQTENGGQEGVVPPTNPTPPIDEWGNGSTSTQIEAQVGDSWSPEQQMVVVLISLMILSALIGLMWSLFSREQL